MKKSLIIGLSAVVVISVGFYAGYRLIEKNLEALKDVTIQDVDLTQAVDGVYTGKYGSIPVSAEVRVVIENHEITEITLVRHDNGQGSEAEVLPSMVVQAQSIELELIAGATYSSITILKAIEDALQDAIQG